MTTITRVGQSHEAMGRLRNLPPKIPTKSSPASTPPFQFFECRLQTLEIFVIVGEDEIDIFAKLGRAVKHACLPAHKQSLNLIPPDRRKDFADRGRDQGCLPSKNIAQKSFRSLQNVGSE